MIPCPECLRFQSGSSKPCGDAGGVHSITQADRSIASRLMRSLSSSVMRLITATVCLILIGCASSPPEPVALENCLTGATANWTLLAQPPVEAPTLISLAKSAFANSPEAFEERWHSSGSNLLYCRRQDWCVAESWEFASSNDGWHLVDQHSWVCVTTHNDSCMDSSVNPWRQGSVKPSLHGG